MDKLSITIDPEQWGHLVTKYEPHAGKLQESDFTNGTINNDTDTNGSLAKRKGLVKYNQLLLAAAPKDQYEAIFSDGSRHLLVAASGIIKYSSGDTLFNSVVNGTGFSTLGNFEFATVQDRVYGCNGIDQPIVYDKQTTYGGAAPVTAPRITQMGLLAPTTAVVATAQAVGAVPVGLHNYRVTFIYYDSEESNPGPAMGSPVNVAVNQKVALSSIPLGGYGVTQRNIYRDNNDNVYTLIGYLANNTATTFDDVLAVGALPLPLEDFNTTVPIFGEVRVWLDRLWLSRVVGEPYTLFYSEVSEPDVYFAENQVLCNEEDPITATIVYFDRLIVFNRRSLGQIVGDTPETFRYAAIPSSVGCVDNRTLQIHVLHGVPVLIWLSERGFYTYDGNALEYISDPIEDLVNYNIRQASQSRNSHTDSSLSDFQAGIFSSGIDLTSNPGAITTKGYLNGSLTLGTNPRRDFVTSAQLKTGSPLDNYALEVEDGKLKAILNFYPNMSGGGTLTGSMYYATTPRLQPSVDFAGEGFDTFSGTGQDSNYAYTYAAQKTNAQPRAGTITQVAVRCGAGIPYNPSGHRFKITVWSDSAGTPGSILFQSGILQMPGTGTARFTAACSIAAAAGAIYWLGIERIDVASSRANLVQLNSTTPFATIGKVYNGAWANVSNNPPLNAPQFRVAYTFTVTPVAGSGTWTSDPYDTQSVNTTTATVGTAFFNVNNFGTKTTTMELLASNDNSSYTSVWTLVSRFNSSTPVVVTGYRYFKIKCTMSTTDNRESDALLLAQLTFPNPSPWISPTIDTLSTDTTSYNPQFSIFTTSDPIFPTYEISSSPDGLAWSAWYGPPLNAVPVQRYVRMRFYTPRNAGGTQTSAINNFAMRWVLTSNLISEIIDTAIAPPPGWDVFAAQYAVNGGTVTFEIASGPAPADPGTISYPFTPIVPGNVPSLPPYQYVKYRVTITSANNTVPVISSVTVQWFVTQVASVRPASIFDNGRYYVSLADTTSNINNVILQLDLNAKWRRFGGLNIATMSFFFNRPMVGMGTTGQISRFLEGYLDNGVNIAFDVRTKAFDFNSTYKDISEKLKIPVELLVHAKHTGAKLYFFYSVDDGVTFQPLYMLNGDDFYQTTTSNLDFWIRLKPKWINSIDTGSHIMYRVFSNDENPVAVHAFKPTIMVRKQAPVITG